MQTFAEPHIAFADIRLAVGFDQFAQNWLSLLGIDQPALIEGKAPVANKRHTVGRDELGTFEIILCCTEQIQLDGFAWIFFQITHPLSNAIKATCRDDRPPLMLKYG